ncbi:hypothetical protein Droror1_Dr00027395 [Drosera rotundifolia]
MQKGGKSKLKNQNKKSADCENTFVDLQRRAPSFDAEEPLHAGGNELRRRAPSFNVGEPLHAEEPLHARGSELQRRGATSTPGSRFTPGAVSFGAGEPLHIWGSELRRPGAFHRIGF